MTSRKFQIITTMGTKQQRGVVVNRYFAVHRDSFTSNRRYRITHLQTGFACGSGIATRERAISLARTLTTRLGKHWNFTDPKTVTNNPVFKKVKPILVKAGAYDAAPL